MKQTKKEKPNIGVILLLSVMLAGSLFALVMGIVLFCSGENATPCIVGLVTGGVGTLFFGGGLYLIIRPDKKLGKPALTLLAVVGITLICAIMIGAFYGIMISPFVDAEHYLQVYENPATVTAIVTDHREYSDSETSGYTSHVTYTYDGVRYKNTLYEDRSAKKNLTPLGEKVTLQISPKDPTVQISDLKRSVTWLPLSIIFPVVLLASLWFFLQNRRISSGGKGTPEESTIRRDLHIKISARIFPALVLLSWLGYGFLHLRYATATGDKVPGIVAIVTFAVWVCCMYTNRKDHRYVDEGAYKVSRDTLQNMWETTDAESSTTYHLEYSNGQRTWSAGCSEWEYLSAKIGDTVLAIYLPDHKKPILHYDRGGKAH